MFRKWWGEYTYILYAMSREKETSNNQWNMMTIGKRNVEKLNFIPIARIWCIPAKFISSGKYRSFSLSPESPTCDWLPFTITRYRPWITIRHYYIDQWSATWGGGRGIFKWGSSIIQHRMTLRINRVWDSCTSLSPNHFKLNIIWLLMYIDFNNLFRFRYDFWWINY